MRTITLPAATLPPDGRIGLCTLSYVDVGEPALLRYQRYTDVPKRFEAEAQRRWASAPTPDGLHQCLNRCCLPFYTWVRAQTEALYREVIPLVRARYPEAELPSEMPLTAHPHGPTAPHWFQDQLEASC